jgi:hypothetical protein
LARRSRGLGDVYKRQDQEKFTDLLSVSDKLYDAHANIGLLSFIILTILAVFAHVYQHKMTSPCTNLQM